MTLGLPGLLLIGLALLWTLVVSWTAWMLTHPPRRTYASAVARAMPGTPSELRPARAYESWTFRSGHLDLPVWEVAGDDPAGPVFILTHGWASSRVGMLPRVSGLAPVASRLIAWDLPGHGEAPGRCSLGRAEAAALRGLIESVAGRSSGGALVLYGASLGAGVSLEVANAQSVVRAVIAEAPYRFAGTPARNVLTARGLPYRLTLAPALSLARAPSFDRAADASRVRCPVLALHGTADLVSPPDDGRVIAGAAEQGSFAPIAGAGHNDLWTTHVHASAAAVREFLRGAGLLSGATAAGSAGMDRPTLLA